MLKIWGRPNSIHTQRVLWTSAEAGLAFELVPASATMGPGGHVSGGAEPYGVVDTPEYLAMNPNGTVPTIDDDGFVLWESNTIARYLAQKYAPDTLFGGSPERLALASQWMDWTNARLEPALHMLVMELVRLAPESRDGAKVETVRREILPWLELLDRHLSTRPYTWPATASRSATSRRARRSTAGSCSASTARRSRTCTPGRPAWPSATASSGTSRPGRTT